jgi:hypothetical protein
MANEVLTAGTYLKYCVEVSGKPTSGYTVIPNIKVTPDITGEPESIEVTDLGDLVWRRYIPGLKDPGGAISFTANLTGAFITAWETLVSAYATAKAAGKAVWFEIEVSGVSKSFYFKGEPVALGIDGMDIGAAAEQTAYVVVNDVEGWGTTST